MLLKTIVNNSMKKQKYPRLCIYFKVLIIGDSFDKKVRVLSKIQQDEMVFAFQICKSSKHQIKSFEIKISLTNQYNLLYLALTIIKMQELIYQVILLKLQILQMKICILLSILLVCSYSYSATLALQLGYMSSVAYEQASQINAWSCGPCSKYKILSPKVFQNTTGNIQGFVGYSQSRNAIILSFRGSQDIKNWIINVDTVRTTYSGCSGCQVHAGFYSGYNMVALAVRSDVQRLASQHSGAKIIITGHSLGGALAILAAADLSKTHKIDQVYTFGQPRVGNAAFATYYQSLIANTFRVIDYADIVPHVPPSAFGFQHNSHQIWYQRGMQTYQICVSESANCANSISVGSYSTDDHNLVNYLKLKAVQKSQNLSILQKTLSYIQKMIRSQKLAKTQETVEQIKMVQVEELRKINQLKSNLMIAN